MASTKPVLPLFPQPECESSITTAPVRSLQLAGWVSFPSQTKVLETRFDALSTSRLEDLPIASELLASVLSLKAAIVAYHAPDKKRAKEAHERTCQAEHADLDPVVCLEKQIKRIIAALELKRRQEKEEADRAARHAAEEAAAVLQQQIAGAAEQSGASPEAIASLSAMPMPVPVAQQAPEIERPKGFSTGDQFEVEVTDIQALARAVIEGRAPVEVLQPNLKVLGAMAKALKGNLQIPGVRITKSISVSGRKRT
ncbi:MAG: hypothetical protein ACRD22_04330 [Terriglobia bacterium]